MSDNPEFVPEVSTNQVYRNMETDRCLTDDLDAMDTDLTALKETANSLSANYASKNHTHTGYATSNEVNALQAAIANKADADHTHTGYATSNDISALQTAIAGKADANHTHTGYAAANHTHTGYATTSDIDELQEALNGKAAANHTHTGYATASHNHDTAYAAINHFHAEYASASDVTALQTAVSGKADVNHTHTGYASSSHNHDTVYYTKAQVDSKIEVKANATALNSHAGDTDMHVSDSERTNWNAAYAYAQTPHYTHPSSSGSKHIPSGGSAGKILRWDADGTAVWGNENGGDRIITTTGTGEAYVAEVEGITALTPGVSFIMLPHVANTKVNPTINVNGLGAKNLRMRVSNSTVTTTPLSAVNMLIANKPTRVMYDGAQWIIDIVRPNVTNLYGTLKVEQGGTGGTTAAKARENLDVYSKAEVEALIRQIIAE